MTHYRFGLILITKVLIILFFTVGLFASEEPHVRVLLKECNEKITIHSQDVVQISRSYGGTSSPPFPSATFLKRNGAVEWLEGGKIEKEFWVRSGGKGFLLLDDRPYRGVIRITSQGSRLLVINMLPLEAYVKGTLGLEASPNWPEEALRAQIIASRTFALRNLGRNEADGFDYCSTVLTQAYGGVSAEHPTTNRLVDETRGLVLTFEGEPIEAVFHSQSGGYTDSALNVWGSAVPYLVSVPSPWEKGGSYESWELTLSGKELGAMLEKTGITRGRITHIETKRHPESGRVSEMRIITDRREYTVSAHRFREALGFDFFPSTLFQVEARRYSSEVNYDLPSPPLEPPHEEYEKDKQSLTIQERIAGELSLDDIIEIIEIRQRERELKRSGSSGDRILPMPSPVPSPVESRPQVAEVMTEFIFRGKGFGHGVGLSQLGAVGMALEGYSFEEILQHYFSGCEIRRVRFR